MNQDPTLILLSEFLQKVRPDWHPIGIAAALGECERRGIPAVRIAIAACRVAEDLTAQTPSRIPRDGNHWRIPPLTPPEADWRNPPDRVSTAPPADYIKARSDHRIAEGGST